MQKAGQSILVQKILGVKLSGLFGRKVIFLFILICVLIYNFLPFFLHYFKQSFGSKEQHCIKRYDIYSR